MSTDIYDKLAAYGVAFEGEQGGYVPFEDQMSLGEFASHKGARIVRVRWIGGDYIPGYGKCYDISYIHGVLADGTRIRINDPWNCTLVPKHKMMGALIEWAKEEGVYAKGLGLLERGNWSVLG
jgi:hypothetical protein